VEPIIVFSLNVDLPKNCQKIFFSETLSPEMQNLKLKSIFFKEFREKVKILSTSDLLCRKFAVVCLKIATFCPD